MQHFILGQNYLAGDNGSEKTTITKLLCGLYTPNSGKIIIDGSCYGQQGCALEIGFRCIFRCFHF